MSRRTVAASILDDNGLAKLVEMLVPTLREVIRQEMSALRPLDETWYSPSEIEAMSCGRVRAKTVRAWFQYGQIDGESDGDQVKIYQKTVEELRRNKWRPARQADLSKLPPSRRPKN